MPKEVHAEGKVFRFPDDATDEEIAEALDRELPSPATTALAEHARRAPLAPTDDPDWYGAEREAVAARPAEYLARVKREDEARARDLAARPAPSAPLLERVGDVLSGIPQAAVDTGYDVMRFAQRMTAKGAEKVGLAPEGTAAVVGAFAPQAPDVREAAPALGEAVGIFDKRDREWMTARGRETAEANEATVGGRLAKAAARGVGEIVTMGPAIRSVGLLPTMAAQGAVHAEEGEEAVGALKGGALGVLGPILGKFAAPEAEGLRRILAQGLGWTTGAAIVDPDNATPERVVQDFVIGVGQDFLARKPHATREEVERVIDLAAAQVVGRVRERRTALPAHGDGADATPPTEGLPAGETVAAQPALPEHARRPGRFAPAPQEAVGPAIPLDSGDGLSAVKHTIEEARRQRLAQEAAHQEEASKAPPMPAIFRGVAARRLAETEAEMAPPQPAPDAATMPSRGKPPSPSEPQPGAAAEGTTQALPASPKGAARRPRRLKGEAGVGVLPSSADLRAAVERIRKAVQEQGGGLVGLARGTGDFLKTEFGQRAERIRGQGGGLGDELANAAPVMDTATRRRRRAFHAEETRALRATQGGIAGLGAKGKFARDVQSDPALMRDLVEGRREPTDDVQREATEAMRDWLWKVQDVSAAAGEQQQDAAGNWHAKQRYPRGGPLPMPYMANAEARAIEVIGESHPRWRDYVQAWVGANPNVEPAKIEAYVRQRSRRRGAEGPEAAEFDTALEHRRTFVLPAEMAGAKGETIPLQETNPHHYVRRYSEAVSRAAGVDAVVGQGPDSLIPTLRKEFAERNGGRGTAAFVDFFRAMHGLGPEDYQGLRGTPWDTFRRRWQRIANVSRGLGRMPALVTDAAESVFGNTANINKVTNSVRGVVTGLKDWLSRVRGKGHVPEIRREVAEGLKTEHVRDWTIDPQATPIGKAMQVTTQVLREAFARPSDEFQETAAVRATRLRLAEMRAEKANERRVLDLKTATGISDRKARDFWDGKLPPAEEAVIVNQFLHGTVAKGLMTNLSPGERGTFEQRGMVRGWFKYPGWPTGNIRFAVNRMRAAWESYRQGLTHKEPDGAKIDAGTAASRAARGAVEGARFLSLKAAQGLLSTLAWSWVSPFTSQEEELKKLQADPEGYLLESAFWGVISGPFAGLIRGAVNSTSGTLPERVGQAAVRSTLPGQLWRNVVVPASEGDGSKVLERNVPLSNIGGGR